MVAQLFAAAHRAVETSLPQTYPETVTHIKIWLRTSLKDLTCFKPNMAKVNSVDLFFVFAFGRKAGGAVKKSRNKMHSSLAYLVLLPH